MPRYRVVIELEAPDEHEGFLMAQKMVSKAPKAQKASLEDIWRETDRNLSNRLEFLRLGTVPKA